MQIVDTFVCFAQVIFAVICMMLPLVVGETSEIPPKEPTPEPGKAQSEKDEALATKGDDPVEMGDDPVETDTDDECIIACEQKARARYEDCKSESYETICIAKAKYVEYHCYGVCAVVDLF